MIDDKFKQLSLEKQERILNAAMKEFAQKGYKNASTNEIVKEAGISKGSLFQYFHSKANLYLYLYKYFTQLILKEIEQKQALNERDIFVRYRLFSEIKIGLFKKYPVIIEFIQQVIKEDDAEVKVELDRFNQTLIPIYHNLLANVDLSPFKEDIDIPKAIDIIMWSMEGFANRQRDKVFLSTHPYSFEEVLAELDEYIEFLKRLFYRD